MWLTVSTFRMARHRPEHPGPRDSLQPCCRPKALLLQEQQRLLNDVTTTAAGAPRLLPLLTWSWLAPNRQLARPEHTGTACVYTCTVCIVVRAPPPSMTTHCDNLARMYRGGTRVNPGLTRRTDIL